MDCWYNRVCSSLSISLVQLTTLEISIARPVTKKAPVLHAQIEQLYMKVTCSSIQSSVKQKLRSESGESVIECLM